MNAVRSIAQSALIVLASVGLDIPSGHAETYPSNVIRIVVPTAPGTPPDIISRVVAAELSEGEGWRIVVENRPGALQTIGMAEVLKQSADGYTVYPMSVPTTAVPALMPNLGMRPDIDFIPVIKLSKSYNALVVPPSFPANSVTELVSLLKREPGRYNFSSAGSGLPLTSLLRCSSSKPGQTPTHVPYQQSQQRIGDLLNGTNHFDFLATVSAGDFVATGKLRALGVTSPDRVAGLEKVASVVEQGFPNLVVEDYVGFAVKSGTSKDIVTRLNEAVNKALQKPRVVETFAKLGATPAGGTAEDFANLIKTQVAHWAQVVRESGIKMPQ